MLELNGEEKNIKRMESSRTGLDFRGVIKYLLFKGIIMTVKMKCDSCGEHKEYPMIDSGNGLYMCLDCLGNNTAQHPSYEYNKLQERCNKFGQQKVADIIGFSRVVVNRVLNGKQGMSRLMKYAIHEQSDEKIEYNLVLKKVIEYVGNNQDRIDDVFYTLPEDLKRFYNL